MKAFFDTSSIFKLYHKEEGTQALLQIIDSGKVESIFISELTKLEFSSTIWKKIRTKEIDESTGTKIISLFSEDLSKFDIIPIDKEIIQNAGQVLNLYGLSGLRTLDSIQLSTALFLKNKVNLFLTSDNLLNSFFTKEELNSVI